MGIWVYGMYALMRAYGLRTIRFGGHIHHPFNMSLRARPQSEGKDQDLEKQSDLIDTNPSN